MRYPENLTRKTNCVQNTTNYEENHPKGWFFIILYYGLNVPGGEASVFQKEEAEL